MCTESFIFDCWICDVVLMPLIGYSACLTIIRVSESNECHWLAIQFVLHLVLFPVPAAIFLCLSSKF
jgi:hypothetical protein